MKSPWPSNLINGFQKSISQFDSFERLSLFKRFSALGIGTLIAQVLMAVNAILLARHLSPSAYGQLVIVFSISSITSIVFNFGLDTWILKTGPAEQNVEEITGTVISIKTSLGVAWLILLAFLIPSFQPQVFPQILLIISALDIWMDSLLKAQNAAFAVQDKFGRIARLMLLARGGRLLGTVLLIAFGSRILIHFALMRLLATLFTALIALYILKPKFARVSLRTYHTILTQSLSYAVSDMLSLLYLQADVSLLGVLLGNTHEVGLYTPASGLISALFVIPYSAYMVLVPYLSKLHVNKHIPSTIVRDVFIGLTVIGLLLWLSISLFGEQIAVLLLGDEYQSSGLLLKRLSPILLFKSTSFAAVAFLVAVDWQQKRLGVQAVTALINLILNLILIPSLGVWGAARAYLMSEMLLMLGYLWLARSWRRKGSNQVERFEG